MNQYQNEIPAMSIEKEGDWKVNRKTGRKWRPIENHVVQVQNSFQALRADKKEDDDDDEEMTSSAPLPQSVCQMQPIVVRQGWGANAANCRKAGLVGECGRPGETNVRTR